MQGRGLWRSWGRLRRFRLCGVLPKRRRGEIETKEQI
mgnify:CR=1 FL=1